MMGLLPLPFVDFFLAKANFFSNSSPSVWYRFFFDLWSLVVYELFRRFVAFLLKSISSVSEDELDTGSKKN
jgi:hypothetical protein